MYTDDTVGVPAAVEATEQANEEDAIFQGNLILKQGDQLFFAILKGHVTHWLPRAGDLVLDIHKGHLTTDLNPKGHRKRNIITTFRIVVQIVSIY